MLQPLTKDSFDMVIVQRIKNYLAVSAAFDQPGLLEGTELMRYSRFRHAEQSGNVAYAQFGVKEGTENLYTGRITEYPKKIRKIQKVFFTGNFFLTSLTISSWITIQSHRSISEKSVMVYAPF